LFPSHPIKAPFLAQVTYVADAGGFRVLSATNLPVAPAVPASPPLVGPAPVEESDEVKAARAEFQAITGRSICSSNEPHMSALVYFKFSMDPGSL
jgi:L-arabinose isomerase